MLCARDRLIFFFPLSFSLPLFLFLVRVTTTSAAFSLFLSRSSYFRIFYDCLMRGEDTKTTRKQFDNLMTCRLERLAFARTECKRLCSLCRETSECAQDGESAKAFQEVPEHFRERYRFPQREREREREREKEKKRQKKSTSMPKTPTLRKEAFQLDNKVSQNIYSAS